MFRAGDRRVRLGWAELVAGLVIGLCPSPAGAWRQVVDYAYEATAVAVDGAGDVIAGGYEMINKYARSTGAQLWHRDMSARAMTVDGAGDVIVALNVSPELSFGAVKLAGSTGAELWRGEITGESARTFAVTVDGSGDVIAAGERGDFIEDGHFVVVKFAGSTGAELWRQEIAGAGTPYHMNYANAVAVDPSGDVIAVGVLGGAGDDFAVIKLAGSTGAELWRQQIDGGASDSDSAYAVTVDSTGQVIAAGKLAVGTTADFAVIEFAGSTGAELWRRVLDGTSGDPYYPDAARAVIVDAADDVIAAGRSSQPGRGGNFNVIKLSAGTGAELWRQEINGTTTAAEDIASAVTVDAAGDVIAAGELINGGREGDFAVIKFAGSTGMEVWRQQIDQDGGPDYAFAVAVEETGDVIAGGGLSHKHYGNPGFAVVELSALDGAAGPARGRSLMVRDLAGTPSARTISAFAQDTSIVTPALGTVGDPTLAGATLRLVNAITLESATFVLPGGASWTARSTATGSLSYLYQDRAGINGPCTRVQVTTGILKAVCTGRAGAIPFTLDEPNQGKLAVSLRLGNGAAQCATFGGKVQRDAGTADPGPLGIFKATKAPAASGDCP